MNVGGRLFFGFLGATLICGPPFLSWLDVHVMQADEVRVTQFGYALTLIICWALGVGLSVRRAEGWDCFFEAAGAPALAIALGQGAQVLIE